MPTPCDRMVTEQLLPRGIDDPLVLEAMRRVPRERFIPPDLRPFAYDDSPLPIGFDQTISQPYIVALMTQSARLTGGARVLEVGSGSGYQAAVLAAIGCQVFTIERIPELAAKVEGVLSRFRYSQVSCRTGDGSLGWAEKAPFDAILVTAGACSPPDPLKEQLKIGGRMILPVGPPEIQQLIRITRLGKEEFVEEILCAVRFIPLIVG